VSHFASQCGHCGRSGTVEYLKSVEIDSRKDVAYTNDQPFDVTYSTNVEVSRCTQCGQPTFVVYGWMDMFDEPDDAFAVRQVYPVARSTDDLPERIARRYGEMLEQLHTPGMFAVGAGRVLEAVCSDRGVPATANKGNFRDLYGRLIQLADEGHLPSELKDQADLFREYRNLGGHDSDVDPTAEDVPLIRDFMEAVLEFLYWGPAKLARGVADLKRRTGGN